jgi:O-antigen/teichoic acid export membrane protein
LGNIYQKFTKDVLVIGLANLLNALSGLVFLPIITKNLGAGDYGIWVQVQATVLLIISFVGLGLPNSLSRFLAAKRDAEEISDEFWSVFFLVFLVSIFVTAIFIGLSNIIAQAFFGGATDLVRITGLFILTWSLNIVFLDLLRAFRQMQKYALFLVVNNYGQLGLIIYLIFNGQGIFSMIVAVVIVNTLTLLALFLIVRHQLGIARPHFSKIKEYLSFGLPLIPFKISYCILFSGDRFVISHFLGTTSVGIYSAAYNLGNLPMMIVVILGLVLPPTLSKLYDEGKIYELKVHLNYSVKYSLALIIPFIFGGSILSVQVLKLFSTTEIASAGYPVFIFVAFNSLILILGEIISEILIPIKKTKISGLAWIFGAVISLILNLILIPRVGILGAPVSSLCAYLVVESIQVSYSLRSIRLEIEWRFIIKAAIASMVMSAVILLIHPETASATILVIILGIMIYAVSLILLKGFKKEELSYFLWFLQQVIPISKKSNAKIE